jgi:hypothetical protein
MINSINWIDGLDGLSSGVSFIAAVTLGIISLTTQVGQPLIAVLCFALAGALLGFLRWNFYPATIFAGTSGVQFVGYTLAVLAILGTAKVAVALLVLGVPIIDTFWIIVRRLSERRSPFSPDRTHIHHRLLDLGLSHRATVLVIYGMCLVFAVLGLLLSGVNQLYAFLGVFIAFGLVLFVPTRGRFLADLEAESYLNGGHSGMPTTTRRGGPARSARAARREPVVAFRAVRQAGSCHLMGICPGVRCPRRHRHRDRRGRAPDRASLGTRRDDGTRSEAGRGAGLPRVVDRSIGMYLLRRARGEPTMGSRREEP